MSNKSIEQIVRHLVMANHDGEMQAIAVVFINAEGEPEIELGFSGGDIYKICTSLDILKHNIMTMIMRDAEKKPKDRE